MVSNQTTIIVQALRELTQRVVKKITLDVTANLFETTPKKTGWARSNWVPKIGEPAEDRVGSKTNVTTAPQQEGVASVVTGYNSGIVSISNNVPYIGILNTGTSTQAPRGFIQACILKAVEAAGR